MAKRNQNQGSNRYGRLARYRRGGGPGRLAKDGFTVVHSKNYSGRTPNPGRGAGA